jgi:predicted nucleotidyltransferase
MGLTMTSRLDPAAPVMTTAASAPGRERLDPEVVAEFAERHHIARISLFGSFLRGDDRPDSDLDLLVEFEPGHTPGYLALATMEAELSTHVGGRHVDIRTAADLSRHFRDRVVHEARLLHAR